MVAWIQAMSRSTQGSIGLSVDNIYLPVLINLPDRTYLTSSTVQQKRIMQKTFADTNILSWRMDQWPSKIKSGMSGLERERACIKIIVNGMQKCLMDCMMNPTEDEIITISSEHSFREDLEMTPTSCHKTSSIDNELWSNADEMDEPEVNVVDLTAMAVVGLGC